MIQSVHIENFKSVVNLTLELGTFNVLIGENGCGKSNILEAIAFGAAASADKLDREFMGSRGIRLTNPEFMYSAFNQGNRPQSISLVFQINNKKISWDLINELGDSKKWVVSKDFLEEQSLEFNNYLNENFDQEDKLINYAVGLFSEKKILANLQKNESLENRLREELSKNIATEFFLKTLYDPNLSKFIIYSPQESSLRKFEDTVQIYPLGIKGEGLFQHLKELFFDNKNEDTLKEIKESLTILDWFEDLTLPQNLMHNEFALNIKDKYLDESLQYFDQKSTNEGFLFLLFYATLFISDQTPTFFAIDNIEASFNPKLCTQLIKNLVLLAKKHGKQVIVTTHNPAVLDGLDLEDDSQRLFVVRRNDEGHTRARRIEYKPERTLPLSQIWTNGSIGGLPDNF